MRNRFIYDAGGASGGTSLKPTLEEISDPNYKPPDLSLQETPDQKIAHEALETETATQVALKIEATNTDGTLKDGYSLVDGKIVKAEPTAEETDLNEDGTLKEGFIKDATGKVIVDPDYKAPEEDFFAVVNKITGREVEVTYPDGVDPISPEGVAIREEAVRDKAFEDFEEYLAKSDPRSYAYMLHRKAGGTDEEFLGGNTGLVLPTIEEMKASADLQKAVYTYELRSKGLDEETITAVVDKAIKDNKLLEKSTVSFTAISTAQENQLAVLQQRKAQDDKAYNDAVSTMITTIKSTIEEGMGFIVPVAKKEEFQKFVTDQLRYENGKFIAIQPVTDIKVMMDSLFFSYVKGDLKSLIAKKAKTEAAQSLKLKIDNGKAKPGGGKDGDSNKIKPTLGEV